MDNVTLSYNKTGSDSCELEFKSDVEGVATTYANLFRRSLLQSTPCYSVAAIRCKAGENYTKNFFEIVPGLSGGLIEISTMLRNAVFDIQTEDDNLILSLELGQKTMLSDVCDMSKCVVKEGYIDSMTLTSQDKILATVVGNNHVELDIFIRRGVGYCQKDVNEVELEKLVGASDAKSWMVIDSQHRGVVYVGYDNEVRLGKQAVTLTVKSHQSNIAEVVKGCTENIINQIQSFLEVFES